MTKTNEAKRIAENTVDAYSRGRYTDAGWRRIAQGLLDAGATAAEAEWVLNSKHMRWAADDANRNHSATSADFLAYANKRKGKEGTGLAGLVLAARRELGVPADAPQTGADLAGACEGEQIADLINLALNVRASSRDERLVAQAARILDEITGRAKGGR